MVEVCVILWKSKVVVAKDTPQLVTVRCNQSAESVSNSSLHVGTEIVRKRKPKAFVFQARDLNINRDTGQVDEEGHVRSYWQNE